MTTPMLQFEDDPAKAAINFAKHGVSFDEAASTFADTNAASWYDEDHSAPATNGSSTSGFPPRSGSSLWFLMRKTD